MPTLHHAACMSDALAKEYVTTTGFSQVDAQRKQEFFKEQTPLVLSESSCRAPEVSNQVGPDP